MKKYVANTNTSKMIDVLMIDSEEKLLTVTKKYFLSKCINIIEANTLQRAWNILYTYRPDLIIIDTIICSLNEHDFMQRVSEEKRLQHIPVIILTAKGLTEDRIKGYKLGCSIYMSKPFDPDELECIIMNLLKKSALSTNWMIKTHMILKNIRTKLKLKTFPQLDSKLRLTVAEKIILNDILMGKQTHEIADKHKSSLRHIEHYITRLLDKTLTKNRKELKNLPWNSKYYGE